MSKDKIRKVLTSALTIVAALSMGYFVFYCVMYYKTGENFAGLSVLKEKPAIETSTSKSAEVVRENGSLGEKKVYRVLDKYKTLYNKNKNLIGWLKIADTIIDYPVMQSKNGEYYLDHNFEQEYDKNGTLFVDNQCDVYKPSMNLIVYGHNMKSGKMFGTLKNYSQESYYTKHPYIEFDTIFEEGTYQVMYVFYGKVYTEEEITFKYYQFVSPNSEMEFNSAMGSMTEMSLYNTGVTAQYGDRLLTLSTCDYTEDDGRFVVVAKRID